MLKIGNTEPVGFVASFMKPICRDWQIMLAGGAFFFSCQYGSKFIMNRVSKKFRELDDDHKNEWCVRFTSCVNSIVCLRQTVMFFTHGLGNGRGLLSDGTFDLYEVVPGQSDSTMLLASYFFCWDLPVCLLYKWGPIFTAHGIGSGLGAAIIGWPFADRVSSVFTGLFETSNVFIHSANMMETLDAPKSVVMGLKVIFSLAFIAVRPICGTWAWSKLVLSAKKEHDQGYTRCHNKAALWTLVGVSGGLLALQWLWTKTIILGIGAAMGLCEEPSGAGDHKADERKKLEAAKAAAAADANKTK